MSHKYHNYKNSFYYKDEEVVIDRQQENKDVDLYQKTKNNELLEKIFINRIPTLKYWAHQHYFPGLAVSIEDFFGELIPVFIKAVNGYKIGKGSFNTCLYTFLLNRIKNIKAGKYAKKRKPETYEGPLSSLVLSLDYIYEVNHKTNKDVTLNDHLENKDSKDYEKSIHQYNLNDSIDILSDGDKKVKDILLKFSNGGSLNSIIKECKTKEGSVIIENISLLNSKDIIIQKIKDVENIDNFKLVEYNIEDNILRYKVELKKTEQSDLLIKTIRKLKKNKKYYMSLIKKDKNYV